MAALTWRNVDAPDFRTSLEGIKAVSSILGDAFGGLQQGVQKLDDSDRSKTNADALLKIASASTPEEAKALALELQAGPQARRLNVETIDALMKRPLTLTEQKAKELALSDAQFNSTNTRDAFGRNKAAEPIVNQILTFEASGRNKEADALRTQYRDVLSNQTFDRTSEFTKGALAAEGGFLDNKSTDYDIKFVKPAQVASSRASANASNASAEASRAALIQQREQYQDAKQAESAYAAVARVGGNAQSRLAAVYKIAPSLTPGAQAILFKQMGFTAGGPSGDIEGVLAKGLTNQKTDEYVNRANTLVTAQRQRNDLGLGGVFNTAMQDNKATVPEVATDLLKTFPGQDLKWAKTQINRVIALSSINGKPTVSPRAAALILKRNTDGTLGIKDRLLNAVMPTSGSRLDAFLANEAPVNEEGIRNDISSVTTGSIFNEMTTSKNMSGTLQRIEEAKNISEQATAALRQATARAAIQPESAGDLPAIQAMADAARKNLIDELNRAENRTPARKTNRTQNGAPTPAARASTILKNYQPTRGG